MNFVIPMKTKSSHNRLEMPGCREVFITDTLRFMSIINVSFKLPAVS